MNISLTDTNGTYSIYLSKDFETLDEIVSLLVKPVLLAAGFCEDQLDKHFYRDEFQMSFEDCDDEKEEIAANAAPEQPMEKAVCKKVVAVAPKVVTKTPVEKKAVAKVATARMAG